ncbi:MAG: preprotein translocase subunit SecG [Pseudomonadota bacterium]
MESLILVVHVLLAVAVIGFVLIQHGKGADAGAAFGSGASGTVFGAAGAGNFLARVTTLLATAFFVTSVTLFYLAANRDGGGSVLDELGDSVVQPLAPVDEEVPALVPSGSGSDTGTDSELPNVNQ